jgi:uncharacterized protein (DUF433 family)
MRREVPARYDREGLKLSSTREGRMNLPEFLIDHPDGEIRLTGHRISLYDVISFHQEGYTSERLHEQYPSLPLPLIRQVLDFYRENRAEVDAYVAEYGADLERLRAAAPKAPSLEELRNRMQALKREEAR